MARITREEYQELLCRKRPAFTNKYHNKPTVVNDIRFASKAEARRYEILKALAEKGFITELKLQETFTFPCGIKYRADFSYLLNGKKVVEDVKGFSTNTFLMKEKMFKKHYPDCDFRIIKK